MIRIGSALMVKGEKMPRYVDLNNPKIIHTDRDKFGNGIYHIPPDLPTLDLVEVVRCKDCKYWFARSLSNGASLCERHTVYGNAALWTKGEWYCADGERREDG